MSVAAVFAAVTPALDALPLMTWTKTVKELGTSYEGRVLASDGRPVPRSPYAFLLVGASGDVAGALTTVDPPAVLRLTHEQALHALALAVGA